MRMQMLAACGLAALFVISVPSVASAQLPDPGMTVDKKTAIVITDPQVDFLSPQGVTWGVVGKSVTRNNTVENLESLFKAARRHGMPVVVSPHYYYPHDDQWKFGGAVEVMMHKIGMFKRKGPLDLTGFRNSGADWMPQYRKYIDGKNVAVANPHKVYGPESNDLALQLRKRGIDKVILAGMSANLCVEAHLRELLEQGFEVVVVTDATAAAQVPDLDGYKAAMTNFRFLASDMWTTRETVNKISRASARKR